MKKNIYTLITFFIVSLSMTVFTSCEDEEIASTLEGTWAGDMYVEHEWSGRWYVTDYSEVTFLRDPYHYSSGQGYWVDYFNTKTPWGQKHYANHITWSVRNGVINIYFIEDDVDMQIRDYQLSNRRFEGQVYASDGAWYDFSLRYVASPESYDDYYWGYDDRYFYAKKNSMMEETDSVTSVVPQQTTDASHSSHHRRVVKRN